MDTSDLAMRMKGYEKASKSYLTRRVPVVIRLDGKAFHTFTRKFDRPFDSILRDAMNNTMKYLCENIQGCVIGYTQSDEITLVLQDYKTIHTEAWFEYNVQKCASIAASMATMAFNNKLREAIDIKYHDDFNNRGLDNRDNFDSDDSWNKAFSKLEDDYDRYYSKVGAAMFDARVFNVPFEDVCNNLVWRQNDAVRNSIQMVGQANFSHTELQNKSCNMIQDMLMTQKGINWNNYPAHLKRGTCCVREKYEFENEHTNGPVTRTRWKIDYDTPTFTQDREYVESRVYLRDEGV